MRKIFCISAGQITSKKNNSTFSKKHRYLNYGFLKLATHLGKHGYDPILIHGLFDSPYDTYHFCQKNGIYENNCPILISIPSYFAMAWVIEFIGHIRSQNGTKKIVVGGRWVVGKNKEWLKELLKVDLVVEGLVGGNIVSIVDNLMPYKEKSMAMNCSFTYSESTFIDYNYLHEAELFQPSIEVSSGCGMGCSFCEERDIPLTKLKAPEMVAKEMEMLVTDDGRVERTPYLESSMFIAKKTWAEKLLEERQKLGVIGAWRVETRVDKLKVNNIPALAKAGLKVIDLGLESASLVQLKRMKKTTDPRKYLERALDLIRVAYNNGIWVKINILLYAGETSKTVDETMDWVSKNGKYIKGVSVGPVIVYGVNGDEASFVSEVEKYGARTVPSDIVGVTYLNLSDEITYEDSLVLSKEISREFMTSKDYFDLKSFSYFSRDYEYSDFLKDLGGGEDTELSFRMK